MSNPGKISDLLDGAISPLNGALDVNVQSPVQQLFQYYLIIVEKADISLTSDAAVNDETLNVSAGHGFTVGKIITVWDGEFVSQLTVTSVNVNAIGVSIPIDRPFLSASSIITRGEKNLAVDASIAPVIAEYLPITGTMPVDFNCIAISIDSGANEQDDGKFGAAAELLNGMYFRKGNGVFTNLGNFKNTRDFVTYGFTREYVPASKGPSGANSMSIRICLKDIYTQEVRNSPLSLENIYVNLRDDITGGGKNTSVIISLLGSYTAGEV